TITKGVLKGAKCAFDSDQRTREEMYGNTWMRMETPAHDSSRAFDDSKPFTGVPMALGSTHHVGSGSADGRPGGAGHLAFSPRHLPIAMALCRSQRLHCGNHAQPAMVWAFAGSHGGRIGRWGTTLVGR